MVMVSSNVYEMYVANGNRAGFWIQRNNWGNTCALVRTIDGRSEGVLEGKEPYFSNVEVRADIYDLASGRLKQERAEVSCPGTSAYRQIDPPVTLGK